LPEPDTVFTKNNLNLYLKELAKEFKKLNGTAAHAEIILIGGAAIVANYGFREMTTDIDAVIQAASSMKDAINRVGDKFRLPNGWLNTDFMRTSSYSPRLIEIAIHYKTFYHAVEIRTVAAEYLIAMKVRSGRKYKNDLSDVLGILAEHNERGCPITLDRIDDAVCKLYNGWSEIAPDVKQMIGDAVIDNRYAEAYAAVREEEKRTKDVLLDFERTHPRAVSPSNVDDILATLKAKQSGQDR
jgi:hypothetical protein